MSPVMIFAISRSRFVLNFAASNEWNEGALEYIWRIVLGQ
jgi:hypothetical protein